MAPNNFIAKVIGIGPKQKVMEFVDTRNITVIGGCLEDVIYLEEHNPDTVVALFEQRKVVEGVVTNDPIQYTCYNLLSLQTWFVKSGKDVLPDNRVQLSIKSFEEIMNSNLKAKLVHLVPYREVLQMYGRSQMEGIKVWRYGGPDDDINDTTAIALFEIGNFEPPIYICYNVKSLQTWFGNAQSIAMDTKQDWAFPANRVKLRSVLPDTRVLVLADDYERIRTHPVAFATRAGPRIRRLEWGSSAR